MNIRANNHFVPEFYLKNFCNSEGDIFVSRLIVSDERVPLWFPKKPSQIAYQEHLYTSVSAEEKRDVDAFEVWIEKEFENPAAPAIKKAVQDAPLTKKDWHAIIRFLAAQHVRTPARLLEIARRCDNSLEALLKETVTEESVSQALENSKNAIPQATVLDGKLIRPTFRVDINQTPDENGLVKISAHALNSRSMWLFLVEHLLRGVAQHLLSHRWTILKPAKGFFWPTSDDPAMCLNFTNPQAYDFGGGWGATGTDIILPISPEHLVHTQVGNATPLPKGGRLSIEKTVLLQKLLLERAHREIFSVCPIEEISSIRPRKVDKELFEREKEMKKKWPSIHRDAELKFYGG